MFNHNRIRLRITGFALLIAVSALTACSNSTANTTSYSTEDIQILASRVKAKEVTIYSTSDCLYCNQAKSWLNENNIAFTDCDVETSQQCEKKYKYYKADGVPFIVVKRQGKEYLMRDGFDSDELLAALQDGAL